MTKTYKIVFIILFTLLFTGCQGTNTIYLKETIIANQEGKSLDSSYKFFEITVPMQSLDDSIYLSLVGDINDDFEFSNKYRTTEEFEISEEFDIFITDIENELITINMYVPAGYTLNIKSADKSILEIEGIDKLPTVTNEDIENCNLDYGFSEFIEDDLNIKINEECNNIKFIQFGYHDDGNFYTNGEYAEILTIGDSIQRSYRESGNEYFTIPNYEEEYFHKFTNDKVFLLRT